MDPERKVFVLPPGALIHINGLPFFTSKHAEVQGTEGNAKLAGIVASGAGEPPQQSDTGK